MVKVSFNLPDEVYADLRKKAYEEHVAMTDIIIGALAEKPLKNSVVHPVIKGPIHKIPPHEDVPIGIQGLCEHGYEPKLCKFTSCNV